MGGLKSSSIMAGAGVGVFLAVSRSFLTSAAAGEFSTFLTLLGWGDSTMLIVESQEESEEQLPGDILEEDEKDLPILEITPGLTSPHFDCFFGEGFLGETFFGVSLFFLVSGEGGKGVLNSSVLRLKSEGLKGVSFSKKESGLTMGVLGTSKNEREWSRSSLVGLVNEVSKKLIVELLELCDVDISLFRLRVSQCNTTQVSLDSKVVDL